MLHPVDEKVKASGELISGCFLPCKKYSAFFKGLAVFMLYMVPSVLYAQKDTLLPNGTDGLVFTPRAADTVFVNKTNDLEANEFEGKYATFRIGMGYIGDFTGYAQDNTFKQQMDSAKLDLNAHYQTRDFRILGSGRLLTTKRYIAYKFAYMYDGDKKVWMIRETGLTIGFLN